jgi:hypothetical protein
MRTTVRLPDELLRRAKRAARERNTTLTALLERGLRDVLRDPTGQNSFEMPPVSPETGGVLPGIDLVKTGELLELDKTGVPSRNSIDPSGCDRPSRVQRLHQVVSVSDRSSR